MMVGAKTPKGAAVNRSTLVAAADIEGGTTTYMIVSAATIDILLFKVLFIIFQFQIFKAKANLR